MTAAKIITAQADVDRRLSDLGLTRHNIMQIVEACVASRANCTDNDPPIAPGWETWRGGVRRAREVLRPLGWDKDDQSNISTVVNPEAKIKVAIANTDTATCVSSATPRNSSKKGAASERAVGKNTLYLFKDMEEQYEKSREISEYPIWYLCVHANGDDVRAELSLPVELDVGYFSEFEERIFIILPGEWSGINIIDDEDDDYPDLEVNVHRK